MRTRAEREQWISARRAAEHLGYEPGVGPSRRDPAMRAFYAFVGRHRARLGTQKVGGLIRFRVSDLDRAFSKERSAEVKSCDENPTARGVRRAIEDARRAAAQSA